MCSGAIVGRFTVCGVLYERVRHISDVTIVLPNIALRLVTFYFFKPVSLLTFVSSAGGFYSFASLATFFFCFLKVSLSLPPPARDFVWVLGLLLGWTTLF